MKRARSISLWVLTAVVFSFAIAIAIISIGADQFTYNQSARFYQRWRQVDVNANSYAIEYFPASYNWSRIFYKAEDITDDQRFLIVSMGDTIHYPHVATTKLFIGGFTYSACLEGSTAEFDFAIGIVTGTSVGTGDVKWVWRQIFQGDMCATFQYDYDSIGMDWNEIYTNDEESNAAWGDTASIGEAIGGTTDPNAGDIVGIIDNKNASGTLNINGIIKYRSE